MLLIVLRGNDLLDLTIWAGFKGACWVDVARTYLDWVVRKMTRKGWGGSHRPDSESSNFPHFVLLASQKRHGIAPVAS